jgi:Mn-dependent DtxR family transcriptional regulator
MIGVDNEIGNNGAEGIEDNLHYETLKKLEEFMNAMKENWAQTIIGYSTLIP